MVEAQEMIDASTATLLELERRLVQEIEQKSSELHELRESLSKIQSAIARLEGRSVASDRAPRGQNRTLILDYLRQNPDASPVAIADGTGIAKPTTYATLAKLTQDGLIRRSQGGKPTYKVKP